MRRAFTAPSPARACHECDTPATRDAQFELRFGSLFDPGRAYAFPCDAGGQVPLERLPQRQQQTLLRVLQLVGREYAAPVIAPALQ